MAAPKVRAENGKGHWLSTAGATELPEAQGFGTQAGRVGTPTGLISATAVNRWPRTWGCDQARMTPAPPTVRTTRSYRTWLVRRSPSGGTSSMSNCSSHLVTSATARIEPSGPNGYRRDKPLAREQRADRVGAVAGGDAADLK